jgi:hypothetical protein
VGELVTVLLIWISAQTGLAMPPPPQVEIVSKEEISELAYGRSWHPSDDVPALYDRDTRTIYLRNDWSPSDLRSRARLLHELVHHAQTSNDVPARCPADREPLAYHLALKWLEEQGAADAYKILDIDEFSIFIRSLCPDA